MYRTESTIVFTHDSAYHVLPGAFHLTITNGADFDDREEVQLTDQDQVALLHLLAQRLGYTLSHHDDKEEERAEDALTSARYTANRVSAQATGDTERLADALCDVITFLINREG